MSDLLTLQQLLDVPALRLRAVHLPDAAAAIRWVATSELTDPAPFLEGGELLLTTGLDTGAWSGEWDGYVARLAAAGVAGIGLAVDLTHHESPAGLVAACRARRTNLLEVPRETTFVAVSRTAARMLDEAERSAMQGTLAVQRRLTEAAMRPDDVSAVLAALASTGGAACVVGGDGAPQHGPVGEHGGLLVAGTIAEEVRRMRPRGLRAAASAGTPGGTLLVHPLGLRTRPTSYLAAAFPGRPTALQRSSVATAVALLSMAVEQRRERRDADRRVRSRALEMLVAGDLRTAEVLLSARSPGGRQLPARLVVLRAAGAGDALDDALGHLEHRHPASGMVGGELVAAVPPGESGPAAAALVDRGLQVGLGEAAPPGTLSGSYRTAGHALAVATEATPLVSWEASVRQGVLSLVEGGRASAFAESFLRPLHGHDELLETLRSFLRHHGSQLRVAGDLGVHRNTVRHRVALIEAALGESLQDPRVRVNAWVALQALVPDEG